MQNIRVHLIVNGKVQGVWFRESTRLKAVELLVKGWVKNRPDGTVEIVAESMEPNMKNFVEWCHEGPPRAVVSSVTLTNQEFRDEFDSFNIVF
ncbi:MAG: acylphosphatase [Deltaproteobacteria bacterium]|nr:acylphosphatase [Deltaproteobacteria bacterium]